ncbi:MAG: N-acetyltransferase [uncultured bacterium (gcode 4)]|uniref:N-acetyltransferase n=1 Tax=uncultured bacterium (gcode 4) TaxID=1234023 RepID=K2G335_9BACT|nr:MAG: N-acetyltransferase [uncultured bacterium (gcode 4)]
MKYREVSHAERLFEILSNPNFTYISVKPKTLEEEIEYIQKAEKGRQENSEHHFTVFLDSEIVWAFWIKIDDSRKHVWKIWCYIDEKYWWKWIANFATRWCLDFMKNELKLHLCEILAHPDNSWSQALMIKNGFTKVWTMKDYYSINWEFQPRDIFYKIL